MWYVTIIGSASIMLLGAATYSLLLWICGWRMPGRLRRRHRQPDNRLNNIKLWIVLGYYVLLGNIILFGFLFIKYIVRGDI